RRFQSNQLVLEQQDLHRRLVHVVQIFTTAVDQMRKAVAHSRRLPKATRQTLRGQDRRADLPVRRENARSGLEPRRARAHEVDMAAELGTSTGFRKATCSRSSGPGCPITT